MNANLVIIDDFYNNVDEVRSFALSQVFHVVGNFPGSRTKSFLNESTKHIISRILHPIAGNVTDWGESDGLSGSFQLTNSNDRSWIHADPFNTWAGVLYLTPDAPTSGGTGLFRRKSTGKTIQQTGEVLADGESQDMTKWELVNSVGNIYNRLVMYRGDHWHTSLDYFGTNLQDSRLTQVFFITTEY